MKRFLVYFLSTIIIGLIIVSLDRYTLIIKEEANKTFNLLPSILFGTIKPIIIGVLLKIPSLILNWRQTNWGFDWVKFLSIGLITLFFTTNYIRSYFGLSLEPLGDYNYYFILTIPTVSGIVFGYILLSCIRYDKTEN